MLQLPDGARLGKISVIPSNWNKRGADISKPWVIHFRIYLPGQKPMQRQLAGMNIYKTVSERRQATEIILAEIQDFYTTPPENEHRHMPFIAALTEAAKKKQYVKGARTDVESIIRAMNTAAIQLGFNRLMISQISRKHVKLMLEHQFVINPRFTAHRFNKCKAYLSGLFTELIELEAIDTNPARDIKNLKVFKKLRKVTNRNEREQIDKHLKENHYRFWLFTNIFFHSGARETELGMLRAKDVDLVNQTFTCIIRKGTSTREVQRTIKDIALPFWKEALEGCKPDQYIFSKHLKPGDKPIRPDQFGRRWTKYVKAPENKGGLGISADFYSLKHSNTTEITRLKGATTAAKLNGHTSTKMVEQVYDVERFDREHDEIKGLTNSFA